MLTWIVITPLSFGASVTDEERTKAGVVLCDKEYRIVSPDGEKELGKYGIKAVLIETDTKIAIDEHLSMDHRGKKAEYWSKVL